MFEQIENLHQKVGDRRDEKLVNEASRATQAQPWMKVIIDS